MTQLLTIPDVAALLKIKPRTASEWVRRGIIPSFLIGSEIRIHPERLDQYLRKAAGVETEPAPRRPGRPLKDYSFDKLFGGPGAGAHRDV